MADIKHTMSLDDGRFVQGLRHAESAAKGSSASMDSGFRRLGSQIDTSVGRLLRFNVAMAAGRGLLRAASASLDAYGSEFDYAGKEVERFENRLKHSFDGINREVFMLAEGIMAPDNPLWAITSAIDSAFVASARALTDLVGGRGSWDAAHNMVLEVEAMDKRNRLMEKYRDLRGDLEQGLATSTGRVFDAQRMVENERHTGQVKSIGGIGLPGDSEELKKLQSIEAQRHAAAIAAIDEREGKERAADERARQAARNEFTHDREQLRLQQMRLNGKGEEADLEEMKLEMEQKSLKIQQSDVLSADEKQAALDDLWNAQLGLESAMKRKQSAARETIGFSGSSVSDVRVRSLILGTGVASRPADAVAKNTKDAVDEAKRTNELLKSIDQSIGRQWVGVFG